AQAPRGLSQGGGEEPPRRNPAGGAGPRRCTPYAKSACPFAGVREEVGEQSECGGRKQSRRCSLQYTREDQHSTRDGKAREGGGNDKAHSSSEKEAAVAESVGQSPAEAQASSERKHIGRNDPGQCGGVHVQVGPDHG